MLATKYFNQLVTTLVILTITILLTIAYYITYNEIKDMKQKQYNQFSYDMNTKLDNMISNKKELTTFIALALAQNHTIIDALEQNNKTLIDTKSLSKIINNKRSYKKLWYQIIDRKGNSFYRSWANKSGDSLLQVRPEIRKMMKNPKTISTISTGKYAMTFKSMVPIFDSQQNYLGAFEVVTHFDSIQKKLLQDSDSYGVFLVDKAYKIYITKPFTNFFIDNYYFTTIPNQQVLNVLNKNGIDYYLKLDQDYLIDEKNEYLITHYIIPDINGNLMGYALIFTPLSKIKINQIVYFKNNVAALMFILVLLTVLLGYYLISKKHQIQIIRQHIQHQQDLVKNTKFQTIGEMAAGITHEINTPLTYIKGTIEMSKLDIQELPDGSIKDRINEDFNTIYNGANKIALIVESMKEMAHSTISTKEKSNVYTTLIIVLRMIHNKSKHIAPIYINNKLFSLEESDLNEKTYIANIHVQRIEQVWTIILNNALDELQKVTKYEKRRIDIDITTKKNKLIIQFTDNAGGISPKIINKIFEPFVSTKTSSGIGIGLHVAKKIVKEHNATINVTNTTDGACFTVILNYIEE